MKELPLNNCKVFGSFFVHSPKRQQYFIEIRGLTICLAVTLDVLSVKFTNEQDTLLDLMCPTKNEDNNALFELSPTEGLNIFIGKSLISFTSNTDGISCDLWSNVDTDEEATSTGYLLANTDFELECVYG